MSVSENNSEPAQERTLRKRNVSQRKIEANRRNSLRSTGPKSKRGKQIVARNAIKHGILAREVEITSGDGQEAMEEFHALTQQLEEHYQPVGIAERLLVQTIANCWWRKARVIRAENGEIRSSLDSLEVDRHLRNSDKSNMDVAMLEFDCDVFNVENKADQQISSLDRWSAVQAGQRDLRSNSAGVAYVSGLLRAARDQVAEGHLTVEMRKKILLAFGLWDALFAASFSYAGCTEIEPNNEVDSNGEGAAMETQENLIKLIDDRLRRMEIFGEWAIEKEKMKVESEKRRLSLPSGNATDKLIRYEAHLDRQLFRATDQLERIQRQRRGEIVPPPLNVNVALRKG